MEREQQLAKSRAAAEALGIPKGYLDQLEEIAAKFDHLRRIGKYCGWGQPPKSAGPMGIFLTCTPDSLAKWQETGYQVFSYGLAGERNGAKIRYVEVRPPTLANEAET